MSVKLLLADPSFPQLQVAGDSESMRGVFQKHLRPLNNKASKPDTRASWSIYGPGKLRIYVLDVPGGDTVTIVVDVPQRSDFRNVIDGAAAFVESFEFLK